MDADGQNLAVKLYDATVLKKLCYKPSRRRIVETAISLANPQNRAKVNE